MHSDLNRRGFLKHAALAGSALTATCLFPTAGILLAAETDKDGWIDLSNDLKAWKEPTGEWFMASSVGIDPKNNRRLMGQPGKGTGLMVNGHSGRTHNLVTRQAWGDVEVSLEFMIPNGSNSGVKLEGVYEIQIVDTWKVAKPTGADCGGIYPRAEEKPQYHHIDNGVPPLVNAAKKPGEWQTLEIVFRAPRFDGRRPENRQRPVRESGAQREADPRSLRGAHPDRRDPAQREHPTGPLLLQADHGPVAFRNVRIRPLPAK